MSAEPQCCSSCLTALSEGLGRLPGGEIQLAKQLRATLGSGAVASTSLRASVIGGLCVSLGGAGACELLCAGTCG